MVNSLVMLNQKNSPVIQDVTENPFPNPIMVNGHVQINTLNRPEKLSRTIIVNFLVLQDMNQNNLLKLLAIWKLVIILTIVKHDV
jgi:hypothetical protein